MAALVLFSIMMLLARIAYTGKVTFIFLPWNLFLAWIPYAITQVLTARGRWIENKWMFLFFFILWIGFVPNSFYILTDLFHLGDHYNDRLVPQWYDLALILSYAWTGLMLGILSVRQMEKICGRFSLGMHELLFIYPVMWLNALGVYTGRYLRFNSWDVISNPFLIFHDILAIVIHPVIYRNAWGMILCYSMLMTLIYLLLKKLSRDIL